MSRFWKLAGKAEKIKEVFDFRNKKFGEVVEIKAEAKAGDKFLSVDVFLPGVNRSDWYVITSGWHTWSGRETVIFVWGLL